MTGQSHSTTRFGYRTMAFVIAGLFAISLRIAFISVERWDRFDADEAVAGLMAKHISEGTAYPVFFYGQSYFGSLESYFNALLFRVAGFHPNLIWLSPLLWSVVLALAAYQMHERLFGKTAALATALIVLFPPFSIFEVLLDAGGGFALAFLVQILALTSYLSLYFGEQIRLRDVVLFGAFSGLSIWIWQLYIPLFFILAVLLILKRRDFRAGQIAIFFLALFLFSLPFSLFNILNHGLSFTSNAERLLATDVSLPIPEIASTYFLRRLWHWQEYLSLILAVLGSPNYLMVLLLIAGAGVSLLRAEWGHGKKATLRFEPAFLYFVICLVLLLFSHRAIRHLVLLPIVLYPVAFSGFTVLLREKRVFQLTLAVVLINISLLFQELFDDQKRVDWQAVHRAIENAGARSGFGDFWSSYPVTFISGERTVISPAITSPDGYRTNRYPEYTSRINGSDGPFFLLLDKGSLDSVMLLQMATASTSETKIKNLESAGLWFVYPLKTNDPPVGYLMKRSHDDVADQME